MEHLNEQFKKISGSVRLLEKEKAQARARLLAHMQEAPAHTLRQERITFYSALALLIRRPLPAALALLLFFGGGISYAAEGAVPGDALYGVKVGVNEEVRAALSFSASQKAAWEGRRAERRLEEAEKLAAQGDFTGAVAAHLSTRFESSVASAQEHIARLSEFDQDAALSVSTDVEVKLSAHEGILRELSLRGKKETRDPLNALALKVKIKAGEAAESSQGPAVAASVSAREATTLSAPAFDEQKRGEVRARISKEAAMQMERKAREALTETRQYLEEVRTNLEARVYADAQAHIARAEFAYASAQEAAAAGNFTTAFFSFKEAYMTSLSVKKLLEASVNFNIRILPSGSVEGAVKIDASVRGDTRTESAAWRESAEKLSVLARSAIEKARAMLNAAPSTDVALKAGALLQIALTRFEEGEGEFAGGNYIDAYAAFKAAYTAAVDAQTISREKAAAPSVLPTSAVDAGNKEQGNTDDGEGRGASNEPINVDINNAGPKLRIF